jgi:hypothetical protein
MNVPMAIWQWVLSPTSIQSAYIFLALKCSILLLLALPRLEGSIIQLNSIWNESYSQLSVSFSLISTLLTIWLLLRLQPVQFASTARSIYNDPTTGAYASNLACVNLCVLISTRDELHTTSIQEIVWSLEITQEHYNICPPKSERRSLEFSETPIYREFEETYKEALLNLIFGSYVSVQCQLC